MMVNLKEKNTTGKEVESNGDYLTIPAMGRFAEIGTPYSEYTGDFYPGVNVFKDLNKKHIKSNKVDSVKTHVKVSDLRKMEANNELGSLHCLSEFTKINENSEKNIKAKANVKTGEKESMQHSIKKVQRLCNRYSCVDVLEKTQPLSFHQEALKLDATHFVVGIKWGAEMEICWDAEVTVEAETAINQLNSCLDVNNCEDGDQVECEDLIDNEKALAETKVESQTGKENASGALSSDIDLRSEESVKGVNDLFVTKSNGFENSHMPRTIVGAGTIMESVNAWKMVNDDKGFPLYYYIIPMSCVNQSPPLEPLTKKFTDSINDILNQIENYQATINLYEFLINQYNQYLPLRYESQEFLVLRKARFELDQLKQNSIALIPKSRKAGINPEMEINIQPIYQKELARFEMVNEYLRHLKERIQFIEEIEERGVVYAKRTFSLTNCIVNNLNESVCIYFAESWNEGDSFKENKQVLFKLAEETESIAIFLDKELFDIFGDKHGLVFLYEGMDSNDLHHQC